MSVINEITIDLLRPVKNIIHVVQEDSLRIVRLTLLADNAPFNVSEHVSAGETLLKFVEFRKPDGHGGIYDETSLGDVAVTPVAGEANIWDVAFDEQCFTCPGWTQVNVRFETNTGRKLHTFAIMVNVEHTASSDNESIDWNHGIVPGYARVEIVPASAEISSSGLISYKNTYGVTLFTLQLPLYAGGVE